VRHGLAAEVVTHRRVLVVLQVRERVVVALSRAVVERGTQLGARHRMTVDQGEHFGGEHSRGDDERDHRRSSK
jgi:hypothetical protein